MRHRTRIAALTVLVASAALLAAGCGGPVAIGTMPVSGTSIMEARIVACAAVDGPVKVEADFHTVLPDWVKVGVTGNQPGYEAWLANTAGRHFEWTSAAVTAGSCWSFNISSGCMCCDPCPPVTEFGFDYRVSQP